MQLRSGKIVLSPFSNNNNIFQFRSGRVVGRVKYTPRSYIKRKHNIELRSGRLVSHKKYTKRPYTKRPYIKLTKLYALVSSCNTMAKVLLEDGKEPKCVNMLTFLVAFGGVKPKPVAAT